MTLPPSDPPWATPTHRDLLNTWSQLCAVSEMPDPSILVVPESDGLAACAFYPGEDRPVAMCIDEIVRTVITERIASNPWPWAALISPAFMKTMSPEEWDREDIYSGDLQRRYTDGDEEVREVVCVTLVDVTSGPSTCTFSQPLLEEIGETGTEVQGPVLDALCRAILYSIMSN